MAVSRNEKIRRSRKKITPETSPADGSETTSSEKHPFFIVGIGASAGGLDALEKLFSNMPQDSGMAFVVVQHLDATRRSSVPEILTRYTRIPVYEAGDGVKVEPDCIYLLPPNKDMTIEKGCLHLHELTQRERLRLPIDSFFLSLARERESSAICIILSGTGSDGTLGLRAIKESLGTVFVQDPQSASYDGMPHSAINTGLVDFVLPPEQIPEKLVNLVKYCAINGARTSDLEEEKESLQQIFAIMLSRTGHDFSRYKHTTIRRRLERRMSLGHVNRIADYARLLQENEIEVQALLKDIMIGVTSFFRDIEAFEILKNNLKDLIERKAQNDPLRIWVAGCATGEEAYSVAMVVFECLDELKKHLQVQVYATDIDTDALAKARAHTYPSGIAPDVKPERLSRFFIEDGDHYRLSKELREIIVFAPHDFIKDPPFSRMDLVCCRNLLIYLESDLQKMILPILHYALEPNGILFLGPSETTGNAGNLFKPLDKKWKIYQRREVVVGRGKLIFPPRYSLIMREHGVTGEPAQRLDEARISQLTEKIFLDNYAPTFAVIDEGYHLLYVRGRMGNYLEITSGQPSLSIMEMAREGLRTELYSAIKKATSTKKEVVNEGVRIKNESGFQTVNITVAPITKHGLPPGLLMVVFQDVGLPVAGEKTRAAPRSHKRISDLEEEIKLTKESLQIAIEELETANEEMKSANEELQSNNEELQSTNEELDTSREELQSMNEELITVNTELQDKNDQLGLINDDLSNFLNRTDIATIFLDANLIIRRFTPATIDVFKLINIDIDRSLEDITSRLDYESLIYDAREVIRSLTPKKIEIQRKDGRWFYVCIFPYLTAQNEINGLVINFIDIERQKQAEKELELMNQQLEDLARFPEEDINPVLRVNRDGTILYANKACGMLGIPTSQIGHHLPENYKIAVTMALDTGVNRMIEVESNERIFSLDFVPVVDRGYVNIYGSDITERKRMEGERYKIGRLESVSTLAGGIAHDFNNLLTAIIGNISLAKIYIEPEAEIAERLEEAEKASVRAKDLTLQLLTFAKGGAPVKKLTLLSSIIKKSTGFALHGSTVKPVFAINDDLRDAEVDEGQVAQVIHNIVKNASESMSEGGVINISARNITIDSESVLPLSTGIYVEIAVKDTGAGIRQDIIDKVFEPYFSTKQKGSGLGLAISYSIIKKHGGHITLDSKPGAGTTFRIYLPASSEKAPKKDKKESQPIFIGQGRILVMDDEEVIRLVLSRTLEKAGYEVEVTVDGAEAVERYIKARESGAPFDAVIMDLTVPGGMGGKEAIDKLLEIDPGVKAVVSSGYADDPIMADYRDYGFSAVVAKPYNVADITRMLHRLLKDKG
ncbi:chemotaxis protein CheB [Chloroflexota bacterium]